MTMSHQKEKEIFRRQAKEATTTRDADGPDEEHSTSTDAVERRRGRSPGGQAAWVGDSSARGTALASPRASSPPSHRREGKKRATVPPLSTNTRHRHGTRPTHGSRSTRRQARENVRRENARQAKAGMGPRTAPRKQPPTRHALLHGHTCHAQKESKHQYGAS